MIADSILDYFENDREEYFSSNLKSKLIEFSWPKLLGNFENCIFLKSSFFKEFFKCLEYFCLSLSSHILSHKFI